MVFPRNAKEKVAEVAVLLIKGLGKTLFKN